MHLFSRSPFTPVVDRIQVSGASHTWTWLGHTGDMSTNGNILFDAENK